MVTPYSFQGTLVYPPDEGQPAATRAFTQSGNYASKIEADYVLTGSGVQVVDFGSVADAKAILVEVASDAAAPINLRFNGGTDDHEVAAGGFYAASNPVPATGVSALSIVYTADAKVTVRILG